MGLRVLTDWIAEAPTNAEIRIIRSRLWRELGRTKNAIEDAQLALDANQNAAAKKLLGVLQGLPN